MMIVRGLLSAAKANMLECDKKMSLSESCDPLKEYLERNRKSVQKNNSLVGCLLRNKKIPIGNFGLILFSITCYHTCVFSCGMWNLRLSGIKEHGPLCGI